MWNPFGHTTALDKYNALTRQIGDVPQSNSGDNPGMSATGQPIYWYIFCMQCGKNAMMGPFNTQTEAREAAMRKLSGWKYHIFGFATRDRAKAIQMLKHDIATNGAAAKALNVMRNSVG